MKFFIILAGLAALVATIQAQTTTEAGEPEGGGEPGGAEPGLVGPSTPRPGGPGGATTPRPGAPGTLSTPMPGGPVGPSTPRPGGPGAPSTPRPGGPGAPSTPRPGGPGGPPRCKGQVRNPSCQGAKNEGNSFGPRCGAHANHRMWHYSRQHRQCQRLAYKGCGGNRNRFCTKAACDRMCLRRGGGGGNE